MTITTLTAMRAFALALTLALTLGAAHFTAARAFAAGVDLGVVATAPLRHTAAPVTTTIRIDFDRPLNTSTITASSFRVFGRWSGTKSGAFAFSNANQRVTFTPNTPFSAGEFVFVNLANTIAAADATPLRSAGFAFAFRTITAPSDLVFAAADTLSNRITPDEQTRIYGASASDLDEDGFLDLTTINEVSADVRVFLNRGDGSGLYENFLTPQDIGFEASPNEPVDFNNDGHSDLCTAATSSENIYVLLGAGDGTFASTQAIATGNAPYGIAPLDVDGDGDLDIVNACNSSNNLALFINNGAGVFGAATFFEGGVNGEYGLVAADMNNDGISDLVVAGRNGQQIATRLGNGNGTFSAAGAAQASGGFTWVIAVDDLNGDGDLDVSCANSFSGNGSILLGNGDGTFAAATITNVGAHLPSTDLADVDGDGDVDWLLSSFGGGFWRLYTNNGAGVFAFNQDFLAPANPSCAVIYDSDNDGDVDFALTDEIADVIVLQKNLGAGSNVGAAPVGGLRAFASPNPFRDGTRLRFALPRAASLRLEIFDTAGRRVRAQDLAALPAGWQEHRFDGRNENGERLASGTYLYRLRGADNEIAGRFSIVR
ncbi:MAG: FG-GAP-like repeat-containing protein [bacterium]